MHPMDIASSSTPKTRTKILSTVTIIALLALVVMVDLKRRAAEQELQRLSVRLEQLTGNEQANREAAARIVEKVKSHIRIPEGVEPTVARIVDVNALRQRNAFYNNAENGDYLVVTPERAILFDPEGDRIIDVVPVQIQPNPPAQQQKKQQGTQTTP